MKKNSILTISFFAWAVSAWGQDSTALPAKENKLGIGIVFNDEAPLAARIWFGPKVGIDAGLGVRARRVDDITDTAQTPTRRVSLVDLNFDLGIPVRILRKEKVDLIVRPGFGFRTRPDFFVDPSNPSVRSIETGVELEFNTTAGFEYFPVERASFSLLTGFAVVAVRPGGSGETGTQFRSLPSHKGVNFAFRYYLR